MFRRIIGRISRFIVKVFLRPKWVAFQCHKESSPELGLKIWGVTIALYKAEPILYDATELANIRIPGKREFGESLHPVA